MNDTKTGVNLENLAQLCEAVEAGGSDHFIMGSDRYYLENNRCAHCFGGRVQSLSYNFFQSPVTRTEKFLNISEEDAVNLCCWVPNEYPEWTKQERFEWALRRLDELKEKGQLERLPLYYEKLRSTI